jgi:transcriptional regulator of heat shock response
MGEYKIKESEKKNLSIRQAEDLDSDNFENLMKEKARILSNLTSEAVILSFGRESIYYTGLTNLFSKPEFEEVRLVISFSEILDKLDEAVQKLLKKNWKGVKILIGSESPFGKECSVIIGNYKIKKWHGLMGILGPLRIDYEKCVALLKYLLDNLEVK